MKYTVFVGDKPSKKNIDPNVPFVGTQSYKTLLMWIWRLDIDINKVMMINKDMLELFDKSADEENRYRRHAYVALGNEAAKELDRYGIEYFLLPHPSGLNRTLNNKQYVDSQLEKCHNYLRGKNGCVISAINGKIKK